LYVTLGRLFIGGTSESREKETLFVKGLTSRPAGTVAMTIFT
jgi:hypothetical protein